MRIFIINVLFAVFLVIMPLIIIKTTRQPIPLTSLLRILLNMFINHFKIQRLCEIHLQISLFRKLIVITRILCHLCLWILHLENLCLVQLPQNFIALMMMICCGATLSTLIISWLMPFLGFILQINLGRLLSYLLQRMK